MDHPLTLGQRVVFTPHREAINTLRYDGAAIEGHVVSADRTSAGHWRYRLRNDDLVPVRPTRESVTYSQEGTFTPALPIDFSSLRRFERLRAAGDDPQPIQNAIHALRVVCARRGDTNIDFWNRWGCFIGATDIADKSGDQAAHWMARQLLRQPWDDADLPRAGVAVPSQSGVAGVGRAIEQHDRVAAELDRFRAAEESRIADVENLIPDAPEIGLARAALASMVATTLRHRDELRSDLAVAAGAEAVARAIAHEAAAMAWSKVTPADVCKRPSASAISGWFPCDHDGRTVWSDGAMVDLASEPHVAGWSTHRSQTRVGKDVTHTIPTSEGLPVVPLAIHATLHKKQDAQIAMVSRCAVAFMAAKYARYFGSKFGDIQYRFHPANPVRDTFTVWRKGTLVGVVMPIQRPPMTPADLDALLQQADALRARNASAQAA